MKKRAYLDIETTGISRYSKNITIIGIALETGNEEMEMVQLYNENLNDVRVFEALEGVDEIYTYNGSRFDLPFIKFSMGIDLNKEFEHRDLMYDCWKKNLKGGLKKVEKLLEIERELKDVDGAEAVRLWWQYVNGYDEEALRKLLLYNSEDVINLKVLRKKLGVE